MNTQTNKQNKTKNTTQQNKTKQNKTKTYSNDQNNTTEEYERFFKNLLGPIMFAATFDLVTRVGLPLHLETPKDGSLVFN